jgi:hypothetical protein
MSSFGDLDAAGAFAGADEAATAAKKAAYLKNIMGIKEEGDAYARRIKELDYGLYGGDGVERKAEGGMIGAMGPQGSPQQNPIAARYGQYIQSAMQAGVQPLPLEKFTDLLMRTQIQLQQAPAQAPMGYAEGGAVDVDGKLVLGPGTGKSDSIPAVIDGERPAALSTGEFVMPIEAVKFFGLQRLNKMVEAARKGQQGGDTGGDAYAQGGPVRRGLDVYDFPTTKEQANWSIRDALELSRDARGREAKEHYARMANDAFRSRFNIEHPMFDKLK